MSSSVKYLRDRLERFLPRCIPDLKLKCDALHADEERTELDAHRHFVILREFIVAHTVHQA